MKVMIVAAAAALAAAPAVATTLRITVTNAAQPTGLALTPVFTVLHDGSLDLFTAGAPASAEVEEIAELGSTGGLEAANAGRPQGVVLGDAQPPILGGEMGSVEIDVADPSQDRFFSFLSMVVPSNDTFIGNDDPFAFELFDAAGAFLGPRTIDVTGAFVYDAGTELFDVANAAFAFPNPSGADAVSGPLAADNGGVVTRDGLDLTGFAGAQTPFFFVTNDPAQLSFDAAGAAAFSLATITIEDVAPIPLPATAWLLLAGLGATAALRRRG